MIALFIGRFQPFHEGHLDALKQISEDDIIIGIGSAQYEKTKDNPYNFSERKKMLQNILVELKNKNIKIAALPDIHDPPRWVEHVKKIVGKFDMVYTGNKTTQKLFAEKGYKVKRIKIKIQTSGTKIRNEASRLFEHLQKTCHSYEDCLKLAPLTLEINELKKKQKAVILAHSYQAPEIIYGVADYVGDSYGLSKIAAETNAKKIVFCSVRFMGETAKILNPKKQVIIPAPAGCSLAKSITAEEVKKLRRKHPRAGVVCYINTYASVKAQSDICCTSSNALKAIDSMPQDEIIFIPDALMGKNLQKLTKKKLILWNGVCVVHEKFNAQSILQLRRQYPDAKILAHTECHPAVVDTADMAGSTNDILKYVKTTKAKNLMLITECGITDRVKIEFKDKNIVGTCNLCPYMKKTALKDILAALKKPGKKQIVSIPKNTLQKAKEALDKMLKI